LFATESRKTLSEKQKSDHLLRRGSAEKNPIRPSSARVT
jgi:hypothetical protein